MAVPRPPTGQPKHPESLACLVRKLGILTSTGRTAAIRQHILDRPAPIVADALSYHPVTTDKIATQIGGHLESLHPPVITQELATVEYASSPVRDSGGETGTYPNDD